MWEPPSRGESAGLASRPGSSVLTVLPTLGLLDRVHDYDCGALGRERNLIRAVLPALRFENA